MTTSIPNIDVGIVYKYYIFLSCFNKIYLNMRQYVVLVCALATVGACWAQSSGTFPAEPFNSLQINYSVSGVSVTNSEDKEGFVTVRHMVGNYSGRELRVRGTAGGQAPTCNTSYGSFWNHVTVTVWAGDRRESYSAPVTKKCGNAKTSYDFDITVPIPKGKTRGGFSINLVWENPRHGNRGLVVSGEFTGGSASANEDLKGQSADSAAQPKATNDEGIWNGDWLTAVGIGAMLAIVISAIIKIVNSTASIGAGLTHDNGSNIDSHNNKSPPITIKDALGNKHEYEYDPEAGGYVNLLTGGLLDPTLWQEYNRNLPANEEFRNTQWEKLQNRDTAFDRHLGEMAAKAAEEMGKILREQKERKIELLRFFQQCDLTDAVIANRIANNYDDLVSFAEGVEWIADKSIDFCENLATGGGIVAGPMHPATIIKYAYHGIKGAAYGASKVYHEGGPNQTAGDYAKNVIGHGLLNFGKAGASDMLQNAHLGGWNSLNKIDEIQTFKIPSFKPGIKNVPTLQTIYKLQRNPAGDLAFSRTTRTILSDGKRALKVHYTQLGEAVVNTVKSSGSGKIIDKGCDLFTPQK